MAVAPSRRESVATDREDFLQRRLGLAKGRARVHVAGELTLARTVRARTRATHRLPLVLAHRSVIPGHLEHPALGHDLPVGGAVEDISHETDDTDVQATIDDFKRIEMRVGRVTAVDDFPEARNPSYKLTIDFGPLGTRRSSAAVR